MTVTPPSTPFQLEDDQNVDVTLSFTGTDDAGNTVPVVPDAGSVTATASDTSALQVTVSADQSSFNAKALGPIDASMSVAVAATANSGALPISGTWSVTEVASPATSATVDFSAGTPVHN